MASLLDPIGRNNDTGEKPCLIKKALRHRIFSCSYDVYMVGREKPCLIKKALRHINLTVKCDFDFSR